MAAVQHQAGAADMQGMDHFCRHCGTALTGPFCASCGHPARSSAEPVPAPRTARPERTPADGRPRARSRRRTLAWVAVISLYVVGAAGFVPLLLDHLDSRPDSDGTQIRSSTVSEPRPDPDTYRAFVVLDGTPAIPEWMSGTQAMRELTKQMKAINTGAKTDCSYGVDGGDPAFTTGARVDVYQDGVLVETTELGTGSWRSTMGCRFPITFTADTKGPTPEFMLPNGIRIGLDEYLGTDMPTVTGLREAD